MSLRLFVAVSLDPATRKALGRRLGRAKDDSPAGVRWVAPEGWHFTLQFLGETHEGQASLLKQALAAAAARHAPFELVLAGTGAFPSERSARVVWVGVTHGAEALGRLATEVVHETTALGFAAEAREFHAHVTVARLRRPGPVARVVAAMRVPEIAQPVREIVLYRSHLEPSGARYEALARLPLGGPLK